jgi:hypothetical protein
MLNWKPDGLYPDPNAHVLGTHFVRFREVASTRP